MNFLFFIFLFVLGLCCGSFLNTWIWRTRMGQKSSFGRSKCPHCKGILAWYDLFPLVSYFILKGSCRKCHKKISVQYPCGEVVTAILFVSVGYIKIQSTDISWFVSFDPHFWLLLVRHLSILFFLEFVCFYDFLYGEIPAKTTVVPGLFLLAFSLFFQWQSMWGLAIGMCVGAGFFLVQYLVSNGRWIGAGDIGMGFFMGVVLGWPLILVAYFLAYVGGSLFLLPFLVLKKVNRKSKIPFGTFLSVATFLAMMWGDKMLSFCFR